MEITASLFGDMLPASLQQQPNQGYSPDYYGQMQQYYSGYMPGQQLNTAPLQDWYGSESSIPYGGTTFAKRAQPTPTPQPSASTGVEGSSGGGSGDYSGTSGSQAPTDPMQQLLNLNSPLAQGMLSFMPYGLGGALGGYQGATSANQLNDIVGLYGGTLGDKTNPLLGALQGLFGSTPAGVQAANSLAQQFQDIGIFAGYMEAGTDPVIGAMTAALQGDRQLNAQEYGTLGLSVGSQIQSYIGQGMSYRDAVKAAGADFGLDQSVISKAVNSVPLTDSEKLQQQLEASQQQTTGQLSQMQTLLDQYQQMGMSQQEATQRALADMGQNIQGVQSNLTGQINAQGQQFNTLLDQYQQLGMSQQEATQRALADMGKTIQGVESNLTGQINTQGQQFNTLLDQYQQMGMSQQEATQRALADMGQNIQGVQNNLSGQINTQGQQFNTLLQQYQQIGLSQDEAMQRTISDMRTDLSGQVNTQGQQFTMLLDQYQQMGLTQDQALQQTVKDMQTNFAGQLAGVQNNVNGLFNSTTSQIDAQGQQISMLAAQYEQLGFSQQEALNQAIQDVQPAPAPSITVAPPSAPESSGSSQAAQTGMTTNAQGQTVSNDATIAEQDAANFGPSTSTESTSGGKIVCTAMNEAYGFGSFRNRIWLKYSATHLTKAHEVGYHTLFLPLVDLAYKKNVKPLRYALENIARHRSSDLRAEMRNTKRDNLGRAYRAVLEPLCYFVGKLKGY